MSSKHLVLNDALQSYIAPLHSAHGDALLDELRAETLALCGERAEMQISAPQGTLLSLLVAITRARSVVEVGTFTGYSALCMARALPPDGRLLCCDVSEEWTAVGRRYWERAGVAYKIDLRIAPAIETLRALPPGTKFELAFIDADKPGYDAYYELLLPRMRKNALFVFDNMLYHGAIEDTGNEEAVALNALNRKLSTDPRVESVLLPFSDGLHFARVR
jgi:caffeoyl-CoA O-methyltransferase